MDHTRITQNNPEQETLLKLTYLTQNSPPKLILLVFHQNWTDIDSLLSETFAGRKFRGFAVFFRKIAKLKSTKSNRKKTERPKRIFRKYKKKLSIAN